MALDLAPAFLVNAAAGTLLLALAAVVFRVDPDARLSRALAVVLVLRGATNFLGLLGLTEESSPVERVFAVGVPVAMAWFLAVLVAGGLGRRVPRWGSAALAVGGVVACAWAAGSPAWPAGQWPFILFHVKLGTYTLAAAVLAATALRHRGGRDVTGLTWAATGFLLNPLVWALGGAVRLPFLPLSAWEPLLTSEVARVVRWGVTYATIVAAMLVVVALQLAAMARRDRALQRAVLVQLALVGGVVALAVGPIADFDGTFDPAWVDLADALTTVAFGLLVSYAVLRHRVLDVDVRVKESIPFVAAGTLVLLAYGTLELVLAPVLPPDQAALLRVVGVAGLVGGVLAFRGAALRLADAAMPGVRRDEAYFEARRLEIYRDALREAQAVREPHDLDQDPVLRRLRASLGITDREHALLALATQPAARGPPDLVPERTVLGGQYRVLSPLGSGGQGKTFLAKDEVLGRLVVLKVLHGGAGGGDATVREARAFAAVDHPNVVTVHDVQRVGDQTILVMEHVAGGSLRDALAHGPLGADDLDRLVQDLGAALGAVHDAGLVHRDVKPSNVLRHRDGRWKLADFGMARADSDEATIAGLGHDATPAGTPAYMSPEQARGERPTAATDLHAAGLTVSEALRGAPVHVRGPNEGSAEMVRRIARARGRLTPRDTPPHLAPWFDEVLAADPSRRVASAAEMRAAWPGAAPPRSA